MAQTAKRIISGSALTGSAATYYTAATGMTTVIKKLVFCNTTAGTVNVTVYLIPSGGTAGTTNTLTTSKSLVSNETWSCPDAENMVLEQGGFIQALGDGVTIMGSGIEVT